MKRCRRIVRIVLSACETDAVLRTLHPEGNVCEDSGYLLLNVVSTDGELSLSLSLN